MISNKNMSEKIFTFELNKEADQIDIHLNSKGLAELLEILKKLQSSKKADHEHLMTPSWSGNELTEEKIDESKILINKVTIHAWC